MNRAFFMKSKLAQRSMNSISYLFYVIRIDFHRCYSAYTFNFDYHTFFLANVGAFYTFKRSNKYSYAVAFL